MSFVLQQPQGNQFDLAFDASDLLHVLTEFPQSSSPYYQHYFSEPSQQTVVCIADWEDPYRQQFCAPHFNQQFNLGAGDPWLKPPPCEGSTCQPPPCTDCGPHPSVPEPQFVLMLLAFFVALVALKCIWRNQ